MPGVAVYVGKPVPYFQGSDWQSHIEQLEFFFLSNRIDDPGKKKAILLANVLGETFQLIEDLLAPKKPTVGKVTYGGVVRRCRITSNRRGIHWFVSMHLTLG